MSKFPGGCQEHPKTATELLEKIEEDKQFALHFKLEKLVAIAEEILKEMKDHNERPL